MNDSSRLHATYIGGPTLFIEWNGLRLLTDPTFDPAGSKFEPTPAYSLQKNAGPALSSEALEPVDIVLLSHDHHYDNLDYAGRDFLRKVGKTIMTAEGAKRLGAAAHGLKPWESFETTAPDGRVLNITATPARHGPEGGDRGPVIGFVLAFRDDPGNAIYITGDTVWFEGVEAVADRFSIKLVAAFLGAAKVVIAGPSHVTMTAAEAVRLARLFDSAPLIPVHFEGWKHFTESRADIESAFSEAGLASRLLRLEPGVRTELAL
jgi:L-ascorbate metabolism protein UlaG (beta-lactamase superfamily)